MEAVLRERVQNSVAMHCYSNAAFLGERLCAAAPSDTNKHLLATCYQRMGQYPQAYHTLKDTKSPACRYLAAVVCLSMRMYLEAEGELLRLVPGVPSKLSSMPLAKGPPLVSSDSPYCAPSYYFLGLICKQTDRRKAAVAFFNASLAADPFQWSSFEELCALGAEAEASGAFSEQVAQRVQADTRALHRAVAHDHMGTQGLGLGAEHTPAAGAGDAGAGPAGAGAGGAGGGIGVGAGGSAVGGAKQLFTPATHAQDSAGPAFDVVAASPRTPAAPAAGISQRRKFVDEGKLRKVSGRLFTEGPAAPPRRSTRLADTGATGETAAGGQGGTPVGTPGESRRGGGGAMGPSSGTPGARRAGESGVAAREGSGRRGAILTPPSGADAREGAGEPAAGGTPVPRGALATQEAGAGAGRAGPLSAPGAGAGAVSASGAPAAGAAGGTGAGGMEGEQSQAAAESAESEAAGNGPGSGVGSGVGAGAGAGAWLGAWLGAGGEGREGAAGGGGDAKGAPHEQPEVQSPSPSHKASGALVPGAPPPGHDAAAGAPSLQAAAAAAAATAAAAAAEAAAEAAAAGAGEAMQLLRQLGSGLLHISFLRAREGVEVLKRLPQDHFETSWVLCQVGRAHTDVVEWSEADRMFKWARQVAPYSLACVDVYSTVLYQLREDTQLSFLAQEALAADRLAPQPWCAVGNLLSLHKDHDSALRFFRRALQIDPDFTYAHTLCGHEHMVLEEFEDAAMSFRAALKLDPRHYTAWYGLGMVYLKQEKLGMAEHHLRKALALNPHNSVLHCYLGTALHALKRPAEAHAAFEAAIRHGPHNPLPRFHRAQVLLSEDRLPEALEAAKELLHVAAQEPSIYFLLGKIYKRLEQQEKAILHLSMALDLKPPTQEVNLIKAFIEKLNVPDSLANEDDE